MLESIRSGAQSLGVKIAFGVIILVFVFWGVGNFNDRDYSNVVAVVNGEPIVAQEFEKAYQNAEEFILRNNPSITREQLIKDHLGRQVLRDMIQALLMRQEAARAGISVSPLELRMAVDKIPAFQDEKGQFDPEAYKRVLELRRVSPAQYEKDLAEQLLQDKVFTLLTSPVWVDPAEALNRYNYIRERRTADYVFFPAEKYLADSSVSQAEIKDWYEAHQASFAIPAKVDVSYMIVGPESLVDPKSISEESAKTWYETNKAKFQIPERVKAAHILAPVAQDADEQAVNTAFAELGKAVAQLGEGRNFADVANEFNPEGAAGPGGELGWIGRGQTVPEFEEALFAAIPGTVTQPVRTPFGWHIILVEEKQEAGQKPFASVEDEVRKSLAAEEGADKLPEALDNLIEDNILQKPLAESAAKYGLKVARTGLLDAAALAQTLNLAPEGAQAIMAAPAGAPLESALEAGDNYIIARVEAATPAAIKPLADVSGEIEKSLKAEKALEKARGQAEAELAKITEKPEAEVKKMDLTESGPVERDGNIGDFSNDAQASEALFATPAGKWLPQVYVVDSPKGPGALIAKVGKIIPPGEEEFASVESVIYNGAKQARMEAIYGLFIQHLADKARIEITNQILVDRRSM